MNHPYGAATTPRRTSGHRATACQNRDHLRKSSAKQTIAGCLNAVQRIANKMSFNGFKMLIARLTALRNGIDSAKTSDDIHEQVGMAQAYLADALQMKSWNPGNFANFYRELKIDAPKSLGEVVRRKKRTASPAPRKTKAAKYDGTEPGDKVDLVLATVRNKPVDPLALDPGSEYDKATKGARSPSMVDEWSRDRRAPFDPDAWLPTGVTRESPEESILDGMQLAASMATANCDVGDSFVT